MTSRASGTRVLRWPVLMSASVMAGLVTAFVGSGTLDLLGWLLIGWPLLPVVVRLFAPRQP